MSLFLKFIELNK